MTLMQGIYQKKGLLEICRFCSHSRYDCLVWDNRYAMDQDIG